MHFEYWTEGFIFIGFFLVIVGLPCVMAVILGVKLIDHIGMYPTKSSAMQMSVALKLAVVQVISFVMLAVFFRIFSD